MRKIEEMTIKEQEINASYEKEVKSSLSSSILSLDEQSIELSNSSAPPVPMARTTILQNTFKNDETNIDDSMDRAEITDTVPDLPPAPVVPFARAKPRKNARNTVGNPILSPHFRNGRKSGAKMRAVPRSSYNTVSRSISRSSVTHSILNVEDVAVETSEKGIQAYLEDENVPIQQTLVSKLSQEYIVKDGRASRQLPR